MQNVLFLSPQILAHRCEPLGEERCQEVALWGLVRLVWIMWLMQDGSCYTSLSRQVKVPAAEVSEPSAGPSPLLILSRLQMMLLFEHLVDSPGVSTAQVLPVEKMMQAWSQGGAVYVGSAEHLLVTSDVLAIICVRTCVWLGRIMSQSQVTIPHHLLSGPLIINMLGSRKIH